MKFFKDKVGNNTYGKMIFSIILILVVLVGTSYAYFNYNRTSEKESIIIAGSIYMEMNDDADLVIDQMYPMSDEDGIKNGAKYQFNIYGHNESEKDLYYGVYLNQGAELTGNRLKDDEIKVYLTQTVNDETSVVYGPGVLKDFNNKLIHADVINKKTARDEELDINYELTVWVDEKVLISDTIKEVEGKRVYTQEEFKNAYATVVPTVVGDFTEKNVNLEVNAVGTLASSGTSYEIGKDYLSTTFTNENVKVRISSEKIVEKFVITNAVTNEVIEKIPVTIDDKSVIEIEYDQSGSFAYYGVYNDGTVSTIGTYNIKIDKNIPTFVMQDGGTYNVENSESYYKIENTLSDIADDNDYEVMYALVGKDEEVSEYNKINLDETTKIVTNVKSGLWDLVVKVIDEAGKEKIDRKTYTISYTAEIVNDNSDVLLEKTTQQLVLGQTYNYLEELPNINNSDFIGYATDSKGINLIKATTKVENNIEKIYAIYKEYGLLVKPTSNNCNSVIYNGESQVLTRDADEGFVYRNNTGVNVGSYTITASLEEGYVWSDDSTGDVSFVCSIDKRDITYKADDATKVYNGTPLTKNSAKLVKGELVSGHTAVFTITGTITDVGTTTNTLNAVVIKDANGNDVSGNYEITKQNGTLTVSNAAATITLEPLTTTYTGSAINIGDAETNSDGTVTYTYYNGDSCEGVSLSGVPTNAGTYSVKASVAATDNYAGATSECVKLTINQKTLTYTATASDKVYDGNTSATCNIVLSGVATGDTVSTTSTGTFENKNVGTDINVTCGSITLTGADAENYKLSSTSTTVKADITKKTITAEASASNKVYDGNTVATCSIKLTGVVTGDTVTATAGTGTFENKNVGTGKKVNCSNIVLSGEGTGNYSLSNTSDETTANITAKQLNVANFTYNPITKIYDGKTTAPSGFGVTATTQSGLISGDTVTVSYTGAVYNDVDVNDATSIAVSGMSISGASAGNYVLSSQSYIKTGATITKATGTISLSSKTETYNGSTISIGEAIINSGGKITYTYYNDDSCGGTPLSGAPSTAGTYSVKATVAATGNYTSATSSCVKLTINKIAVTYKADDATKVYNGTPLTKNSAKLISGELVSGHTATFTIIGTITNVGSTINTLSAVVIKDASGNDVSTNYEITKQNGTLTVSNAGATISLSPKTETYTGSAINIGDAETNSDGTVTYTYYNGDSCEGNALNGAPTNAGTYSVKASVAATDNYAGATSNCVKLTINQKTLTYTASASDKVYDGNTSATCNIVLSGVATGDTVSTTSTGTFENKNVGTDKNVSCANITLTGTDASNYKLSSTSAIAKADITKKAITAEASASNKVYDGNTTATCSIKLTGVVTGDTVTATAGTGTFENKNVGTGKKVNCSNIVLSGEGAGNYSLSNTSDETTANITAKQLNVANFTYNPITKIYDGKTTAPSGFGVTATENSGLISGDTVTVSYTGAVYNDVDVNDATSIAVSGMSISGASAGNYVLSSQSYTKTGATITKAAGTISITEKTETYNGSAISLSEATTNSNGTVTYTYYNGDSCEGEALNGAPTNAGTYSVKATVAATGNYTSATSSCVKLTINKIAVTYKADDATKVYDETPLTKNSAKLISGELVSGHTATFTITGTITNVGSTINTLSAVVIKDASGNDVSGNYEITKQNGTLKVTEAQAEKPTAANYCNTLIYNGGEQTLTKNAATGYSFVGNKGTDAKEYTITAKLDTGFEWEDGTTTDVTFKCTIEPKEVTYKAEDATKVYNGTPLTKNSAKLISGELVSGHTATFTIIGTITNVGSTINTLSAVVIKDASGNDVSTNYEITKQNGTLTVSNAAATISLSPLTETYTGSAINIGDAETNSDGKVTYTYYNGDSCEGNALNGAPTNAGTYSVKASVAATDNYAGATSNCVKLTINQKTLTYTASASDKVYDGNTSATCNIVLSGVATGDTVSTTSTGTFENKNVGTDKNVSCANITLTGTDASNYKLSSTSAIAKADITKKAITAEASASNKVYDGNTVATCSIKLTGVVTGDTVTATAGTGTFENKNVGTGKKVTCGSITLAGTSAGNYSLGNTSDETTANITAKQLNVANFIYNPITKIYDGKTTAPSGFGVTATENSGLISGDTVTVSYTGAVYNDADVNDATSIAVSGMSISGASAGNYVLSSQSYTKIGATITKATGTISITGKTETYNGSAISLSEATTNSNGTVTYTYYNGDSCEGEVLNGAPTNAGTYSVKATVAATGNYTSATSSCVKLTINKIAVTYKADDATKVYDETPLTKNSAKLISGELVSGHTATFTIIGTITNVGTTINTLSAVVIKDASGNDVSGNYEITKQNGTLTVSNAAATISLSPLTETYTGSAINIGDAETNSDGTVTYTYYNGDSCEGNALNGAPTNAGTYSVKASVAATDNYAGATSECVKLTINQKTLTYAASASDKVYDGNTTATCNIVLSGVATGDTVSTTSTGTFENKNVGTDKNVSCANITLTGTDASNYKLSSTSTTVKADITKKAITAEASASNKVYDGNTVATCSIKLTGVVTGDTVTATAGTGTFENKNVGTGKKVNCSNIVLSGEGAGNYSLSNTSDETTANITAKQLNVANFIYNPITKIYDGKTTAPSGFGVTATENSGLISGDTVTVSYTGAVYNDVDVNDATSIAVSGMSISGASAGNYVLSSQSYTKTGATITKAAGTISITEKTETYNGSAISLSEATTNSNGTVTYTYYNGDSCEGEALNGAPTNAGTYSVKATVAATGNYTSATSSCVKLTINKIAVTYKADDATKVYDETPLTKNSAKLISGELVSGHTATFTIIGTITNVGTTINTLSAVVIKDASGNDVSGNYEITKQNGTLTVSNAAATISLSPLTETYTGSAINIGDAETNSDGTVTYTYYNGDSCEGNALNGAPTNAGTYSVKASVAATDNYAGATSNCVKLVINKIAVTYKSDDATKVYDGAPLTKNSAKLVKGELISGHTATFTTTGTLTNVGTSENTLSAVIIKDTSGTDVSANYEITKQNGTLTVTKASCTCEIKSYTDTMEYPGDPSGTIVYACSGDGTIYSNSSDTAIITLSNTTETSTSMTAKNSGSSTITVGRNAGTNYNACSVTQSVSVTTSTFTITLNPGEGTVSPTENWTASGSNVTQNISYGSTLGELPTPTRTGYTFNGWYTAENGGTEVTSSTSVPSQNTTYYAQWTGISYTVNYYLGDGLEAGSETAGVTKIGSSTCIYGSTCTLKTWESFDKNFPLSDSDWSFAGWNSSKTLADVLYSDSEGFIYNQTNDIDLYAIGYKDYYFNSGIAPTAADSIQRQYWNSFSLYESHFSAIEVPEPSEIEGWSFIGYGQSNTAASAAVSLTETGTQVLIATDYPHTTFRAIYQRDVIIEYDANGGTGSVANSKKVQYYNSGFAIDGANNGANVNDVLFTLANNSFTNDGYAFNKWAEGSANGTNYSAGGEYTFDNEVTESNTVTMYATWVIKNYTINYYLGNGTSEAGATKIGSSTCTYGASCTLADWDTFNVTFPGSTYRWAHAGWSESQTLAEFKYSDAETFTYDKEGNMNLYALGYRTFTFFSGKAPTTAKSIETQYWNPYSTHASHASSIPVPTATGLGNGWTFYGYLQANSVNGNVQVPSAGEQVLDVEKYTGAYFRTVYSRTATIRYNANGGSGTTADTTDTQYYNSGYASNNVNTGSGNSTIDMVLANSGFTRSGYNFNKWAKGSASGTTYEAGTIYTFDNNVSQSYLVNMYATWTTAQVCNSSCGSCLTWSDWSSTSSVSITRSCDLNPELTMNSTTVKYSMCSPSSQGNNMCTWNCKVQTKSCTQYPCC